MSKYKVIVNPTSGRGYGDEAIPQIERLLSEYNLDFDLVRTERPWHTAELAQEATTAGYDVVVAVGGDGTANKVLNGLMQAKRVGESARGTCNGYRVRRPTITQPSLVISIMNGQRMGGGFFMAPDGKPDDGMLDLCIAREVSRARIFGLVLHFMRGTQATQEPIKMGQAREIVVTAIKGALPAHADGETLCTDGQRLEMELLPGQIEIIYQPPEAI